jgi:hypothetical protein
MRQFTALLVSLMMVAVGDGATTSPATTQSAELPPPTRVTLKLDHTPAVEALRSLFDQAHIPTDDILTEAFAQQLENVTVTAQLIDQPYNVALLEICRQAWLEPQYSWFQGQRLTLAIRRPRTAPPPRSSRPATTRSSTSRPSMRGVVFRTSPRGATRDRGTRSAAPATVPSWVDAPMTVAGPFVVVAENARRFRRADLESESNNSENEGLHLSLLVLRDPRLRVMGMADRLQVDEARTDDGAGLVPTGADAGEASTLRPIGDRATDPMRMSVALAYPPQTSRSIALLRGHMSVNVLTRAQPVDLLKAGALVQEGAQRQAGDIRFAVSKLSETGDGCQLVLTIWFASGGQAAFDEVRSLIHDDSLHVIDPTGASWTVHAVVHSFRDNQRYEGTIQLRPLRNREHPKPPKTPAGLVWDVPLEAVEARVPVELKNLPLP